MHVKGDCSTSQKCKDLVMLCANQDKAETFYYLNYMPMAQCSAEHCRSFKQM